MQGCANVSGLAANPWLWGLIAMNMSNEMTSTEVLANKLAMLRRDHSALDMQILELGLVALPDRIAIQRLKKQKLALKDQITTLSAQLIPNIIA
jgi:hypothetical protein